MTVADNYYTTIARNLQRITSSSRTNQWWMMPIPIVVLLFTTSVQRTNDSRLLCRYGIMEFNSKIQRHFFFKLLFGWLESMSYDFIVNQYGPENPANSRSAIHDANYSPLRYNQLLCRSNGYQLDKNQSPHTICEYLHMLLITTITTTIIPRLSVSIRRIACTDATVTLSEMHSCGFANDTHKYE